MAQIPWAILISVGVLSIAFLIKHFLAEVIEQRNVFLCVIGIFIAIYIGAALAVSVLNPHIIAIQDDLAAIE